MTVDGGGPGELGRDGGPEALSRLPITGIGRAFVGLGTTAATAGGPNAEATPLLPQSGLYPRL